MDDEDVLSFGSERHFDAKRGLPRRVWLVAGSVAGAALLAGAGVAVSSVAGHAAAPHHAQVSTARTGGSVFADLPVVQTISASTAKMTEPRGYPRCKGH